MNIEYMPRALRDLKEISDYLNERNPAGTRRVLAAIKSSIDTLAIFPGIGRIVDDNEHRRLSIVNYPYVVFYRIAGEDVLIIHTRHTARKPVDPAVDL
jgi:toxin ParE1/3/4